MLIRVVTMLLIVAALPFTSLADTTAATLYSYSTKVVDHITDIAVSQRADTFMVELIGRMQGSSTVLYDQTFDFAFADPAMQAAIVILQGALTGNGAVSFLGPTLVSTSTLPVGSIAEAVDAILSSTVTTAPTTYVGPKTVFIGENQGTAFTLYSGQMDIDILAQTDRYINRTTTTTDTFLTQAIYEWEGVAAVTPPTAPVPEPATLCLMAVGLMGLCGTARRKRIAKR